MKLPRRKIIVSATFMFNLVTGCGFRAGPSVKECLEDGGTALVLQSGSTEVNVSGSGSGGTQSGEGDADFWTEQDTTFVCLHEDQFVSLQENCADSEKGEYLADLDADGFGDGGSTPILACRAAVFWLPESGEAVAYVPAANGQDCDDRNAAVHPGADDPFDGVDQDCDGRPDVPESCSEEDFQRWYPDRDSDGFGDSTATAFESCDRPVLVTPGPFGGVVSWVANDEDCDDGDAHAFPGADEVWNGRDDDCDGRIDVAADGATPDDPVELYVCDADNDGHGNYHRIRSSHDGAPPPDGTPHGCPRWLLAGPTLVDCDDTDDSVGAQDPEFYTCAGWY